MRAIDADKIPYTMLYKEDWLKGSGCEAQGACQLWDIRQCMDAAAGAVSRGERMSEWKYDEDTGHVMCRCPMCGGRLPIGLYEYRNPYQYCPYCGTYLDEGKITSKRKEVYNIEWEDSGRNAAIEAHWEFAR